VLNRGRNFNKINKERRIERIKSVNRIKFRIFASGMRGKKIEEDAASPLFKKPSLLSVETPNTPFTPTSPFLRLLGSLNKQ
jgi:hypothetical protein